MSLYDQATWLHKYRWDERLVQWIRNLRGRPVIVWAKTDDVWVTIISFWHVVVFLTLSMMLHADSLIAGSCSLRSTEWSYRPSDIRSCLRSNRKHPLRNRGQLQDSRRSISLYDNRFGILKGNIFTISECLHPALLLPRLNASWVSLWMPSVPSWTSRLVIISSPVLDNTTSGD